MEEIYTTKFLAKFKKLQNLLQEAYEHYFEYGDGHCKSAEGLISIELPPYFWRLEDYLRRPTIGVYSYVLGPSRMHYFDNIDEALEEVSEWHKAEMEETYE